MPIIGLTILVSVLWFVSLELGDLEKLASRENH